MFWIDKITVCHSRENTKSYLIKITLQEFDNDTKDHIERAVEKTIKNKIDPLRRLLLLEDTGSDKSSESEIEISDTKIRPLSVSF